MVAEVATSADVVRVVIETHGATEGNSNLGLAILAAIGAYIVKLLIDAVARYRERCSIAAALAGELEAFDAFVPADTPKAHSNYYRNFANLKKYSHALRRLHFKTSVKPLLTNPVFDKVTDKIGLLPPKTARDVAKVYYLLSSTRVFLSHLSDEPFASQAPNEMQISHLNNVAKIIDQRLEISQRVVAELDRISRESFMSYTRQYIRELFCRKEDSSMVETTPRVIEFAIHQLRAYLRNLLDDPSHLLASDRDVEPQDDINETRQLVADLGLDYDAEIMALGTDYERKRLADIESGVLKPAPKDQQST